MKRREFLVRSAAAVAAGLASSSARAGWQSATKSEPAKPLILGSGSERYECLHDWITPPTGMSFGDTHGVTQDKAGRIYLAQTVGATSEMKDGVCVYDATGKFLHSWGGQFAHGAHGLDLREESGEEFLYHCDTRRRCVEKTALDGRVVWNIGCPMESGVYAKPEEWCPTNVAFSPDGDLFVGDGYGRSFIHRFGKDGSWKKIVARPGAGLGEVNCPHGLWIDPRSSTPTLVVADRGNRRIQVLDLDGKHIAFHTDGVRMPCDMKFRDGAMLVPDLESVVTLYDPAFRPIVSLGDGHPTALRGAQRSGFVPGKFVHPHDAIWLASGDILVAEWVPIGRVTLLRRVA
ncbi:MAG: hypothetical protein EXS03_09865 [Phycisphaerales bacterium]|nr:hypothetical protein [Phycisphaerales bacterium]